jgi:hypothetical protein
MCRNCLQDKFQVKFNLKQMVHFSQTSARQLPCPMSTLTNCPSCYKGRDYDVLFFGFCWHLPPLEGDIHSKGLLKGSEIQNNL